MAVLASVIMGPPALAYSYGDGYALAAKHGSGHSGLCAVRQQTGGESYFCLNGDLFHVMDLASDGKSVGVRWITSNGHSGLCRFAGGAGYAGDCKYDFPESVTVTFWGGLCNRTAAVKLPELDSIHEQVGIDNESCGLAKRSLDEPIPAGSACLGLVCAPVALADGVG